MEFDKTERLWYLIYTKPKQERVALDNLQAQSYATYLPMLSLNKRINKKRQNVLEPMFPRYIFVHLNDSSDNWSPIRSTKGVSHIVKFGQKPAKVPNEFIDFLKENEQSQSESANKEPAFKTGERVRVATGPFAGYEAVYQCEKPGDRAIILLDLVTRFTELKIDQQMIDKAS